VGGFVPKNLKAFAESLGLDMTTFNSCFDSGKYAQKVIDDAAYARSQNVTGTPSFLVNGKLVYANDLAATIEAALAGK
jgi:predicted DsbA family dithiol-disulfide isomerase